ncbi:hypothetical protein QR680_006269 [Steinernema hermaphroditum]|uniref:PDZ domain-containing protein n=1 Tax=Steinernema hermaphroditum TaxID=289476 RepID=A0AA39HUV5_9BILA|nr:hypothetical protein QR680_006269 [Steinernema hermaphroditum]
MSARAEAGTRSNQSGSGHPPLLPPHFVQEVAVEMQFQPEEKSGIIVSKGLLVIKLDQQSAINKLFLCDFITHVNGKAIESKRHFYSLMHGIKKNGNASFTVTVKRPIWNSPTNVLPPGYDRPQGYQYFIGLFVLYPGSYLGIGIKAYNSKVYVSHTEQNSLSASTCYIGDCIVSVGGVPVTGTAECSDLLTASLTKHRFVTLTIERAIDDNAVRAVRMALIADKTQRIDPLMARDCMDIGETETERFQKSNLDGTSAKSIYKKSIKPKRHVSVADMSAESAIGADPYNPMLMQKVPGNMERRLRAMKAKPHCGLTGRMSCHGYRDGDSCFSLNTINTFEMVVYLGAPVWALLIIVHFLVHLCIKSRKVVAAPDEPTNPLKPTQPVMKSLKEAADKSTKVNKSRLQRPSAEASNRTSGVIEKNDVEAKSSKRTVQDDQSARKSSKKTVQDDQSAQKSSKKTVDEDQSARKTSAKEASTSQKSSKKA